MSDMLFVSLTSNLLMPVWPIRQSKTMIFRLTDYEHMLIMYAGEKIWQDPNAPD